MPIVISLDFGKIISKIIISIFFRALVLKHKSFFIYQATPPLFLFLSNQRISYPGRSTLRSSTVWSSFDSVIAITGGNTEKIWAHRFFIKQKANVLKAFKSKLLVLVNNIYCDNDDKMFKMAKENTASQQRTSF